MKTKAAVLYAIGQPLVIEELELEAPREKEILVKWVASGICHSDYSVRDGTLGLTLPAVLGHEGAGIVEAVGPGVTQLAVGDHVIVSLTPQCGNCVFCKEGKPYLCAQMSRGLTKGLQTDGSKRLKNSRGEEIGQLLALGTFSERTVVPAGTAVKVQHNLPLETACLIGCGVTTGVGAALNTVKINPGDSVAVIGCGGVGLSIIQGARIAGATTIIAIDPVAEKRLLAIEVGATHALDPSGENVVKQVRKMTGGGVHFAFEALGRKETIEQAWAMPRLTGTAVIVGVPKKDTMLELPVLGFFGEKHFKGSAYGSSVPSRDIPKYAEMFMSGELKLDALITQRIALEQVNEALDQMGRGEGARSVIGYS
ncbi:MAG: Zn-dependent alcohol dehydrogenase [Polaromonas sp.]|uniref:Zn-dependent alcohol dehydrogenase n=1 Tax=Polaromonas sp. TaxID=1869339 RepID=UPI0027333730|nr:Zn-dependent alcohol dehydrogenase [Polaromonas sp.]MDP3248849.1 Zn-dependent alcohol dehydrogenase [Polaromonas sp.]